MKQQLSESLASRTFIGLLLAQFTTTFNDQAIHMVAVFYSADMLVRFVSVRAIGGSWLRSIDDKAIVSIVTACFIAPFILFSSYAGPLGDRFSKRSVIVFWKVAEVGMMGLALLGLSLPHFVVPDSPSLPTLAVMSSVLVIATVFLMGMHSTFFVPAKLGAMPEILHPAVLSRGNGVLEGTSFTAQILGTSAGGILYSLLKGEVTPTGHLHAGREWMIGVFLLMLALLGTITAFLMRPIPAAAPGRKLSWNWWKPLEENLGILWRSKPLTLSVTGIAFCVFMTLFLRQTLLYQGELTKELRTARAAQATLSGEPHKDAISSLDRFMARVLPSWLEKAAQESELRVALLFALVGLGVGLGSILAGFLSGHRIELGLVPVGALVIVICTLVPGLIRHAPGLFVASLFGIGCGAGFYLVPQYTLLQHRAPKESKGNVVSASNFLNVVGGIISVAVFYAMTFAFEHLMGPSVIRSESKTAVFGAAKLLHDYVQELEKLRQIPHILFLSTAVMTFAAMMYLTTRLPDFYLRTAIWMRAKGHNPLRTEGIENMPTDGPVVLLANTDVFPAALDLVAAVDRFPHMLFVEPPGFKPTWLLWCARHMGWLSIPPIAGAGEWIRAMHTGAETLRKGGMVALTVNQPVCAAETSRLIDAWRSAEPDVVVLPVNCTSGTCATGRPPPAEGSYPRVIIGPALARDIALDQVLIAIDRLGTAPEDPPVG
jgi:acyl-[acyl-carrier-protein]-phospholipid O-acyltransferase/long-chain-fatty-acid--[acyl-carrier-protein] ligase